MVVTVVIPYFNVRRSWFRAAIESALNQNFYDYEILVAVICNPVVQIAALKQPVCCAQFPVIFQG